MAGPENIVRQVAALDDLLKASSFGTAEARSVAERADPRLVSRIVDRVTAGIAGLDGAEPIGYRGPAACQIAGITYRQLDYWARTGLITPSIRNGPTRLYTVKDITLLVVVKRLLDFGPSIKEIRVTVERLRAHPEDELRKITLSTDGTTIHACTSPDEVTERLCSGQMVFGVAVGGAVSKVLADAVEFPAESGADGIPDVDELLTRRRARRRDEGGPSSTR